MENSDPKNLETKTGSETGERTLKKKIGGLKKDAKASEGITNEAKKDDLANQSGTAAPVKVVATPKADAKSTIKIFDMLEQAMNYKQLKKGVNEVMKVLQRHKGEVVILAADTDPLGLLMSLPTMCEQHSVPYCFVESTAALGRACGIERYY